MNYGKERKEKKRMTIRSEKEEYICPEKSDEKSFDDEASVSAISIDEK